MGIRIMKQLIIAISLLTAVAFLVLSVITTYQIFTTLISGEQAVRGELWILLILCFTGGVILLSIAWGIAELTESRRVRRELMLSGRLPAEEPASAQE
jgi:hypothetical protein